MRFATLATACVAALTSVNAQAIDQAYIGQVIQALTAANLTSLADAAQSVANTTEGAALLGQLQGSNKTLLAPNNDAFAAVPADVSSNTTLLANILSLHILNASVPPADVAEGPAHTIVRSLYNNMMLNGNLTVPVVLYRGNETESEDGTNSTGPGVIVQQAGGNVNTTGNATAANFQIYIIDEVLSLPPTLGEAAGELLPSLAGLVEQAGLLDPLEQAMGLTVFAPSNDAIAGLADTLATLNATQVQGVLANHVINGTTVFSTQLSESGPFISAGGQEFMFTTNDTGAYVMSGNASARIIMSDVVIQNGVVHVIDGVLVNAASNPQAAESAASSYAEQATQTTSMQPTGGVVGGSPTSMGTAGASGTQTSAPANSAIKVGGVGMGVWGSVVAVLGGLAVGATLL